MLSLALSLQLRLLPFDEANERKQRRVSSKWFLHSNPCCSCFHFFNFFLTTNKVGVLRAGCLAYCLPLPWPIRASLSLFIFFFCTTRFLHYQKHQSLEALEHSVSASVTRVAPSLRLLLSRAV